MQLYIETKNIKVNDFFRYDIILISFFNVRPTLSWDKLVNIKLTCLSNDLYLHGRRVKEYSLEFSSDSFP